jgi:hypothetical protein
VEAASLKVHQSGVKQKSQLRSTPTKPTPALAHKQRNGGVDTTFIPRHERVLSELEIQRLSQHPFFALDYSLFPPPLLNDACAHVTAIAQTYNEALFLEESVVSAAYTLGEVVLIDHGSTDNTAEIVNRIQQRFPNVRYQYVDRNKYSQGMVKQLALNLTRTEWALRWDVDFLAHNRTIMSNLCTNLAVNTSNADIFSFLIPRVDGDLFHVTPNGYRGSGPEHYLFRRDAMSFGVLEGYDDYPLPRPGMRRSSVSESFGLKGTFMLHLATHKPMPNIARRVYQNRHQVYTRAMIDRGRQPVEYWAWLEMRGRGIDALNATEDMYGSTELVRASRERAIRQMCQTDRLLVYYNIAKWPHTQFVNRLVQRKLMLFFVVPTTTTVGPSRDGSADSASYVTYWPGCPLVGEHTKSPFFPGLANFIEHLPVLE